jgi:glycosyltransferase involved in cell wall biosynthesis
MSRRVRVLHLIDNLDLGGAQNVVFGLLEYFDRNRFEIVLATMHANRKSLYFKRALELGVHFVALSPRRWLPFYVTTLPWLLFRGSFDVVHTHLYASNWLGKPLAKLFRVPVVISHDHCYDRFRFDWPVISKLDAWANGFADWILVIANSIREELIQTERLPAEKIEIMRNGLPERSLPARSPGVRKIIGAAGRLVGWKRFDRFFRIGQQLLELDSEYQFRLAGSGPHEQSLLLLANELGVSEKLVWCGTVVNMDNFFESIDLFLLTSEIEDLPMILLEAMYHGVPSAVITVNASRAELAGNILDLDPHDTEAEWARAIHGLFQDPASCVELSRRGQELMKREYMAEKRARRLENLYDELVSVESLKSKTGCR